jgi:transposase
MDHVGIDIAKVKSQMCILSADGVVLERRFKTSREELARLLGGRPRAKVLLEACGESEWIARVVEELGHEVVVADPSYRVMYGARSAGIKTDRRDAEALAVACQMGAYRTAHRQSEPQRQFRRTIVVREALVRTRAKLVTLVQALLRQDGIRVPSGNSKTFLDRLSRLELPEHLELAIGPLRVAIEPLNGQIDACDELIERRTQMDDRAKLLCTIPGVGPLTSTVFVNTIDDVARFEDPHQLEAYLGLVPREYSSGERQSRGSLTKAGDARTRMLLVEAALRIRRLKNPKTERLWSWSEQVAQRRGKKIATVALARRLAGIMYAMLRDKTEFRFGAKEATTAVAA